jgi:hypothetical protein
MILAYIQVTEKIPAEAENITSVTDSPELVNTGNISPEVPVNNALLSQHNEEDSFEMKYIKLMKQIEKERFERELIAGSR